MQLAFACNTDVALNGFRAFAFIQITGPERSRERGSSFPSAFTLLQSDFDSWAAFAPPRESSFGWQPASGSDHNSTVPVFEGNKNGPGDMASRMDFQRNTTAC